MTTYLSRDLDQYGISINDTLADSEPLVVKPGPPRSGRASLPSENNRAKGEVPTLPRYASCRLAVPDIFVLTDRAHAYFSLLFFQFETFIHLTQGWGSDFLDGRSIHDSLRNLYARDRPFEAFLLVLQSCCHDRRSPERA